MVKRNKRHYAILEASENNAEIVRLRSELSDTTLDLKDVTENLKKMCELCDQQRHQIQRYEAIMMAVKVLTRAASEKQ